MSAPVRREERVPGGRIATTPFCEVVREMEAVASAVSDALRGSSWGITIVLPEGRFKKAAEYVSRRVHLHHASKGS